MKSKNKLAGLLTEHQTEVLRELYQLKIKNDDNYWKLTDIGAHDHSHHSVTVKRLCEKSLILKRIKKEGRKKTFEYCISEKGIILWLKFKELIDLDTLTVLGPEATRDKAKLAKKLANKN